MQVNIIYMIPQTFTVTSEHIRQLFSFYVLHFLVVGSVRIKSD